MAPASGGRIGSYEIVGVFDEGAQGEVYRARDSQLSRDVALKVLRDDRLDAQQRARFERETQVLAALNHPNTATLHGIAEWQGGAGRGLVEGESLAARLLRAPAAHADRLELVDKITGARFVIR
jgi:eukaryotic-like serine/threonine-protein kinase